MAVHPRPPAASTVLSATLMVLALAFAGCAGSDAPDPSQDDAAVPPPAGNTVDAPYTPPVPRLETSVLEGEAPLTVAFTVDAEHDPAQGLLTWSLEVAGDVVAQGDQDGLPVTVEHTFEDAGTYAVEFTVDDGTEPVTATRSITVAAPQVDLPDPVVLEGSAAVPTVTGRLFFCIADDVDGGFHDLAPAGPGWSFTLEPAEGFQVWWWADGAYHSAADGAAGTVPEGVDQAEICSMTAVAEAYQMTLYPPGHPDAPT